MKWNGGHVVSLARVMVIILALLALLLLVGSGVVHVPRRAKG